MPEDRRNKLDGYWDEALRRVDRELKRLARKKDTPELWNEVEKLVWLEHFARVCSEAELEAWLMRQNEKLEKNQP